MQRNEKRTCIAGFVVLLGVALLALAPAAAQAATIFADDFEQGLTGWVMSGSPDWYSGAPSDGERSVQLRKHESLQRRVSTRGYDNIVVRFSLAGLGFNRPLDELDVTWYDSGVWRLLRRIDQGDPMLDGELHALAFRLPPSAAGKDTFTLRFSLADRGNGHTRAYVDDVEILGYAANYTLNLSQVGEGTVRVDGVEQTLPWSQTYPYGTVVSLQARAGADYRFGAWTGDLSGSDASTSVVMEGDKTIVANFIQNQYVLNLIGNGTVLVDGVAHALPWSGIYDPGTRVTLEAVNDTSGTFANWYGDLSGSANPVTITVHKDTNIGAAFSVNRYTLVIMGTGGGNVVVDGVAYALPWSGTYDYGALVAVEAYADDGYGFDGWTGDLNETTNPVYITMDGDKSLTAHFVQGLYVLDLESDGGQVKVDGVAHDLPWSGNYLYGTSVTLEAVSDINRTFSNWYGDLSGVDNPVTITIGGDTGIGVTFTVNRYTLTVAGDGYGTVAVDGVLQTLPWSGTYDYGTSVELDAYPDEGYRFRGWSGDLSGSDPSAVVTVEGDKSVAASFAPDVYALNLTGNGTVSVDGVPQALPWSGVYPYGADVSLEAVSDAGLTFTGWSGALSGSTNPATITHHHGRC